MAPDCENRSQEIHGRTYSEAAKLSVVTRQELLLIVQPELRKHDFDCFLDASQPLPEGRKGVVVPGCPYCKKTIYTMAQFIEHLTLDVLPLIFEREPGVD